MKPSQLLLTLIVVLGIALSAPLTAFGQTGFKPTPEQLENSVALLAKLLCSGVFVVGKDPEWFIEENFAAGVEGMPSFDDIDVNVDYDRKSVTLQITGKTPARTAVFLGDQGCTLLPKGMDTVQFTPVEVESKLPAADSTPWPMGDVLDDSPLPKEVDRNAIEAALDWAFDDSRLDVPQRTRAVVVLYKGRIIGERYAPGYDKDTRHISWSMGKSITAALFGLLVRDGHYQVHDRAPIAEWQGENDPRRELTIANLLNMSSGLRFHTGSPADGTVYTEKDNHRYVYFAAPNVFEYSINRDLEFPPETVWRYRNCDPLSVGKIVRDTVEARGESYHTFPQRELFDPIGARNFVLECDPWGNFIMTGFDYGTARDWARFGLLHLWKGEWQGKRILPEDYVEFLATPAPANKGKNYGGLFWLNAGSEENGLPTDMFWPAGHHGQNVRIIPSRDVVIVRMGHSIRDGFGAYMADLVRKMLAAVESADS